MNAETPESKVLAFYYAWYGTPWGPSESDGWTGWQGERFDPDWVHNGRREVRSVDYPLEGLYDSLSEETIRRHIREAQLAGIDGFVVSWWGFDDVPGANSLPDRATEKLLELAPDDFDVTVYHETVDYDDDRDVGATAVDDISRLVDEYASNPSWLTADGAPVVFEYGRVLNEIETQGGGVASWQRIRDELDREGYEPYLVGDTFDTEYLDVFDGVHTYNPTGMIVRGDDVEETYREAAEAAHSREKLFAGTVLPAYDDRIQTGRTRDGGGYLVVKREDGSRYAKTWDAVTEADSDWALVTSWNEWYEGSTIEPAREYGLDYLDLTSQYADNFRSE